MKISIFFLVIIFTVVTAVPFSVLSPHSHQTLVTHVIPLIVKFHSQIHGRGYSLCVVILRDETCEGLDDKIFLPNMYETQLVPTGSLMDAVIEIKLKTAEGLIEYAESIIINVVLPYDTTRGNAFCNGAVHSLGDSTYLSSNSNDMLSVRMREHSADVMFFADSDHRHSGHASKFVLEYDNLSQELQDRVQPISPDRFCTETEINCSKWFTKDTHPLPFLVSQPQIFQDCPVCGNIVREQLHRDSVAHKFRWLQSNHLSQSPSCAWESIASKDPSATQNGQEIRAGQCDAQPASLWPDITIIGDTDEIIHRRAIHVLKVCAFFCSF